MVNYDLVFLVVFYIILLIIFKIYRNKFEVQWKIFALYKTKIGINLMDKIAKKFPNILVILGYFSVFIGFIGMIITFVFLVHSAYKLFFVPNAEAGLAPLLPGISVSDKLPVLSFWHWILAILIVAVIHEFSHGVYARLRNINIKSSGFAFLGPILAAFVEPDEKQLKKKRARDQLFVFSAGPFSNIILGIVVLGIFLFGFLPLAAGMVQVNGIIIADINENLPISESGIVAGQVIQEVDGEKIERTKTLVDILEKKKPGDIVNVKANDSYYDVKLGASDGKTVLGISYSKFDVELKNKSLSFLYKILGWFGVLLFWIFNISVGVGLFNLLPLGPVDGGRMFYTLIFKITKNERKAIRILSFVSMLVLFLIFVNLLPFIIKLFKFILGF